MNSIYLKSTSDCNPILKRKTGLKPVCLPAALYVVCVCVLHRRPSDPTPRDRPPSFLHSTPRTSDTATETSALATAPRRYISWVCYSGGRDQNSTGWLDTHMTRWSDHWSATTQLLCINIKEKSTG